MKLYTAPEKIDYQDNNTKIFLAGTIDNGDSVDWQKEVCYFFGNREDISIFNPRRRNWGSSMKADTSNPEFVKQVHWEIEALDFSDHIIFNFLPTSKSPISLLEFGLYADSRKLLVCCPKEFYRAGNVEIVCDIYGIPLFRDLQSLLKHLKTLL